MEKKNLRDAILRHATLAGADLANTDLTDAILVGAILTGANLTGAILYRANLRDAILRHATLTGANLTKTNLSGTDLTGADLRNADLTAIREDFRQKCLIRPNELEALRAALVQGKINGQVYNGECQCFVGTLAHAAGVSINHLGFQVDGDSPVERWFLAMRPGDTPENSIIARITLEWLDEVLDEIQNG